MIASQNARWRTTARPMLRKLRKSRRRLRLHRTEPDEHVVLARLQRSPDHGIASERAGPSFEQLQAVADRLLPGAPKLGDLRWSSLFGISMRLAETYRVGNVFIAGDAAPPSKQCTAYRASTSYGQMGTSRISTGD